MKMRYIGGAIFDRIIGATIESGNILTQLTRQALRTERVFDIWVGVSRHLREFPLRAAVISAQRNSSYRTLPKGSLNFPFSIFSQASVPRREANPPGRWGEL
jgi:hypothetical protein